MKQETFKQTMYIQRQKMLVASLAKRPDDKSLIGKVIDCYNDKPEWVLLCNANGWKC